MNNSTICLSFDIILSEERQGVGAWENIYRRKEMKEGGRGNSEWVESEENGGKLCKNA